MSYADKLRRDYKEIRNRLRRPNNAVYDDGIDLTRKSTKAIGERIPLPEEPKTEAVPSEPIPAVIEYHQPKFPLTFNDILELVSVETGVPIEEITGRFRFKELVRARRLVVHLAYKYLRNRTGCSIARGLKKDHTTVMYARNKMPEYLAMDEGLVLTLTNLEETILARFYHPNPAVAPVSEPNLADSHQQENVPGQEIHPVDKGSWHSMDDPKIEPA